MSIKPLVLAVLSVACTSYACADSAAWDWDAVYTVDRMQNVAGGIKRGGATLDNLDVSATYESGNGSFFGQLVVTNSSTFSDEYSGDSQVVSNIDTTSVLRLHQFWYNYQFDSQQRVLVGVLDLNSEFDAIEPAGLFLNSSHGIGADYAQSGGNGPSIYPTPGLSLLFEQPVTNYWSLKLAAFDAVPGDPEDPHRNDFSLSSDEGALLAAQVTRSQDDSSLTLGLWYYTEPSDYGDGSGTGRNSGWYASYSVAQDDGQGYWLRVGRAKQRLNPLDYYVGAGIALPGLKDGHTVGLAVAYAHTSDWASDVLASAEQTWELTYALPVNDWLSLQPDLQYVINPSADPSLDSALVVGLRINLDLGELSSHWR